MHIKYTMKAVQTPKTFAAALAQNMVKLPIIEFFNVIRSRFYPEMNIKFVSHFVKTINHDGEFVVSYNKLLEVGVAVSTRPEDIVFNLERIGLISKTDYVANKTLTCFMLTPDAFKRCLLGSNQWAMYARYYEQLECILHLFVYYQQIYSEIIMDLACQYIDKLEDAANIQAVEITALMNLYDNQPIDISCLDDEAIDYTDIAWY